jgi:KUP system potassium uptake protein
MRFAPRSSVVALFLVQFAEQIVPSRNNKGLIARWIERFFAVMAKNAGNVTDFFNIPANRVMELGACVAI